MSTTGKAIRQHDRVHVASGPHKGRQGRVDAVDEASGKAWVAFETSQNGLSYVFWINMSDLEHAE